MAINLYITSTQNFSGKSAVCVALMHKFRQDGHNVGYFKPFSSAARVLAESSIDEDAQFFKETFGLEESLGTLAPVVVTNQRIKQILNDGGADYSGVVKEAAQAIGKDKDLVIMEGSDNFREGRIVNLSIRNVINLVDGKAIAVIGFQNSLQVVDDILTAVNRFEDRLIGVIVNMVPASQLEYVEEYVTPYMNEKGVDILAVLRQEKRLRSISVGELAESLNSAVLCCGSGDELVENLLVAAMNVEQALQHFRRTPNKAVIAGGDRSDIQLAALETSTKALILTGNMQPNPMVEAKAEEKGVAIIMSAYDTLTTVEKVDQFFGKTRFHQTEKIDRFRSMLDTAMDYDTLYSKLGLK